MKTFLQMVCAASILTLAGCAGLPPRTYSLGYVDEQGRALSGSVSFGDTRLPSRPGWDTLQHEGKTIKPLHTP